MPRRHPGEPQGYADSELRYGRMANPSPAKNLGVPDDEPFVGSSVVFYEFALGVG